MLLTGVLYDAGGPVSSVKIVFEATKTTTNGVLFGADHSFTTQQDGTYAIELESGYYRVHWRERGNRVPLGTVIADETTETTLPAALKAAATPVNPDAYEADFYDLFDDMSAQFDADQAARASEYDANKTQRINEFDTNQADREARFDALLAASGYEYLDDYAAGIEVTEYNQVVRDSSGELWRAAGSTTLPYTTDGTGLPEGGAFVSVGDAALRNELAGEPANGAGALKVRGAVIYVDTIADLQALPTSGLVDGQQVHVKEYHAGTGAGGGEFYWDASRADENDGGTVLDGWVRIGGFDELRITWFGASGRDDGTLDDTAMANVRAAAQSLKMPVRVDGIFEISAQQTWSGQPLSWVGERGAPWRTGSSFTGDAAIIWSGGTTPMFSSDAVGDYFEGFQVANRGAATDFLEKTGGQRVYMHRMSFITGTGESKFTRSVIRSSGNFIGYSHFSTISCKGAAPAFIDIDGLGSANGITPFTINERCIFETGGSDLTVVKVVDESIEHLKISDCSFNEKGGFQLSAVDTSEAPLSTAINVLTLTDNEIDYDGSSPSTNRFAYLSNVKNIIWDGNISVLGGVITSAVELVNSHVASFNGNSWSKLSGPYFNCDTDSTVVVGKNIPDTSNTEGSTNNSSSVGIVNLTYQAVMVLNPQLTDQRSNPLFRADIADGSGYQFRISTTKPNWVAPGTRFTVQVRNVSGAPVSAGAFTNGFVSGIPMTAPSDGSHVIYEFFWDGTVAQPVSGVAPTEMSNT